MGVPKFFRWISERYPCLSELVREYQIPEFDNLYLDMNGIIHMCSHPNDFDPHFRISEEKIFKDIFHYIDILFRMIQPQKLFFMAVDGVAPRAKMNQQRGRRFRSAKEAEVLEQKAREKGEELPNEERFDSNCITPGTVFMARLHEQLKYFVTYKVTNDKLWRKCKIILSGHETPGEGEHKIMDYIRYMKCQPGYDPNTRHCLYGLDADLIMLGLCSHEPHFSLLREEVKFGRKNQKRISTPEETTFFLLHLSLMREYLELEFGCLKTQLSFPFDIEKIIDDWVLMGFLVGNDFIPPLPDMHIVNGALPTLYQAYIEVLPSLGGYINEGGTLHLQRFQKYMEKLAAFDFDQFREFYADLKYFEGKMSGRKTGGKERISYRNKDSSYENSKNVEFSTEEIPSSNPELAALIKSTDDILLDGASSSNEEDDDDFFDRDYYTEEESDDALFYQEFCQHKKHYYMNKLEYEKVTSAVLRSQAECYVRAIQWNLNYYYNGVCSWSWFYPHHYAPYISDIRNFSDLKLEFDMGVPFFPFQQLLAVLPAASKKLLPEPYQTLMVDVDSPIISYYPSSFQTDLNGKRQEWEAVVLIPFIEEVSLLGAMAPCNQMLTEEEQKRNSHGPMLVYTHSEDDLGCYEPPEYFPAMPSNHAKAVAVYRDEILVSRSQLVKGLCPGVRLDVYFPGFPTLKHIPHTASIQKMKVKVFEMPSRGDNMILQINDQVKHDIQEVASQLLGKEIFVDWPHLVEAKVVAVANKDFRYSLLENQGSNGSSSSKTPKFNIEEIKGNVGALWQGQRRNIQERYMNRLGVDIGATQILVYAAAMVGRKFAFGATGKITLEKQWNNIPSAFALQVTVKDISVQAQSFVQYKLLQDVFPPKDIIFLLGHPHYGSMGEVLEVGSGNVRAGRVKVNITVTQEPTLDDIRKKQQESCIRYMQGSVAAQRLGISPHLVSRITGTIYIVHGEFIENVDSPPKTNVGLNLKFNKKNEEIPGYTRKENSVWQYSLTAVQLVASYMEKFPELFDYLSTHTGNDMFYEADVFPNEEVGTGKVSAIANWLKEQPFYKVERQLCGSEVLEPDLVTEMEKVVDVFYETNHRVKTVTMQVKPHLLYKSSLQFGNLAPDRTTVNRLFDRVVNIRENYTVPLGLKGTIVGIHKAEKEIEMLYDILFDKPFDGGLVLNCSANRGYRVSQCSIINLSHGQRTEQVKTVNKPTAVVQPTDNVGVQDGPSNNFVPQWNCGPQWQNSTPPGNMSARPTSAFASWNNHPNNNNHHNLFGVGGPTVFGASLAVAPLAAMQAAPLYHALSIAGTGPPPARGNPNQGPPLSPFAQGGNILRQTQLPQHQPQMNQMNSRKAKGPPVQKQDYSFLMKNSAAPPVQGTDKSPTEFQTLWSELQKAAGAGLASGTPLAASKPTAVPPSTTPLLEVGDSGTELLKKMLRIPDETANAQQQAPPLLQNMKQVSMQDIFEHARATESKRTSVNENASYCIQLLDTFQVKGLGIPRYNYLPPNQEDGSVVAQVILPDRRTFSGESADTREQASENAAKVALNQLGVEAITSRTASIVNNNSSCVVGNKVTNKPVPSNPVPNNVITNNLITNSLITNNPVTNHLPTPPQQWYQQGWPQNQHQQNRFPPHPGYQQVRQGVEPILDWRRGTDITLGRAFENMQMRSNRQVPNRQQQQQQQQQPYIPPFTMQPQVASKQNWTTPARTNWRQQPHPPPPEEPRPGSQFVPLQAVKQHRNKTSAGILQQKQTNGVVQLAVGMPVAPAPVPAPAPAPAPAPPAPVLAAEASTVTPAVSKDSLPATSTPNAPSKTKVPRQRKSRIAANFGNIAPPQGQ